MSLLASFARAASGLRHDVSYASRLVGRTPGFSAVAIITLALAIGANTAVFSVINALLFSPLPVVDAERVMRIRPGESTMSWPNYRDLRERNETFTDMAASRRLTASLAVAERSVRLTGEATSANFFEVLGNRPALGRTYFGADERSDLIVLAHHVWQRHFGGNVEAIGQSLRVAGQSYLVIGVMPPEFRGVRPPGLLADFWVPVDQSSATQLLNDRGRPRFEIVGRLRPGITPAAAASALRVAAQQLRREHPQIGERFVEMDVFSVEGFGAFSGMAGLLVPILGFLSLLIVVSGGVLVIACANIASVLVSRGAARRREIAIRLAVGAGTGRLVRQLLTEGLLLATLGATGGIVLAQWLTQGGAAAASRLPFTFVLNAAVDRRVLAYTAALTVLATLLSALSPARRATRLDLVASLKEDGIASSERRRLLNALVIGQVAACTALLFLSGLFLRSLSRIADVDPGFNPSGVLLATVELEPGTFDDERGERLFVELERRISNTPAVTSAGLASIVPLALMGREEFYVTTDDDRRVRQRVVANRLTPGWFAAVQLPLIAGRDFSVDDRAGSAPVVVVNEALSRQLWDGRALGQRLTDGVIVREIIGVVRNSKYATLGEEIGPAVYLPFRQSYTSMMTLHVRTADSLGTAAAIFDEMRSLAPEVPVEVTAMSDAVAVAVLPARVGAIATAALGAVALLLSLFGVYGLVAYVAVQRTREIGLRKALGAQRTDVVRLLVGSTARVTGIGFGLGVAGGVAIGTATRGFIFGVSTLDGATLAGVAGVVIVVVVVAGLAPTYKSARLEPLAALRKAE